MYFSVTELTTNKRVWFNNIILVYRTISLSHHLGNKNNLFTIRKATRTKRGFKKRLLITTQTYFSNTHN